MPQYPAVISLNALDGTTGFKMYGEVALDALGQTVAVADVNGDGLADLIVTARVNDEGGNAAGAVYVVFGTAAGFSTNFDLSTLDGTNGFKILGAEPIDQAGRGIGSGDVNGDGIDDILIGAWSSPNGLNLAGQGFVVFGQQTGHAVTLDLSDLNGTNGFTLNGAAVSDLAGTSIEGIGDINGDGIEDMLVGAYQADDGGSSSGTAYVVFGSDSGFPADLDLDDLDGSAGFKIFGRANYDNFAYSAAGVGDVNGDGFDDFAVGSTRLFPNQPGVTFVFFGKNTAWDAVIDLGVDEPDGTDGFEIIGESNQDLAGWQLAAAGDINDDGVDDILVSGVWNDEAGANAGAVYVVFGDSGGFAADFNLSSLDGTNGFQITAEAAGDGAGFDLNTGGDINGDGIDDLILGAYGSNANGNNAGAAFVVFGKSSAFTATIALTALTGTDGFQINGEYSYDRAGRSVATGDFNGDGLTDMLIGANEYDGGRGAAYLVYGRQPDAPVSYTGDGDEDAFVGGVGGDTLSGGGGKDRLYGNGGADNLDGGDGNDIVDGGAGTDDILGGLGNDILGGGANADDIAGGDGADKIDGGDGDDIVNGGAGADQIYGGLGADTLNGDSGNDQFDGEDGIDTLSGGLGNDVYIVDGDDIVIEALNEGFDIVRAFVTISDLADNVEGLQFLGVADVDGTGNDISNNIQGNSGANTLRGLGGVDTIHGNDGNDRIIGGQGNDIMRGGNGADVFVVEATFAGPLETDQVQDFAAGQGDYLDFEAIDAIAGGADDDFTIVAAFTGVAGQMTVAFAGGLTSIRLDINGDRVADYQMRINGDIVGTTGSWDL